MDVRPIFIITGPPGAGKSTVARALLQQFEFGLHIPIDDLRAFVVSGMAHPVPEFSSETARQFALARHSAAQMAERYAQAGFVVVIDDVIAPQEGAELFPPDTQMVVHKVLLLPSLPVALERNRTRTNKDFDPSFLEQAIGQIHAWMSNRDWPDWLMLDSSQHTPETTVQAILTANNASQAHPV